MPHIPDGKARNYGSLNDVIFAEAVSKTRQCANQDGPCLLAIGTFHYYASVLCIARKFAEWVLTGEPSFAWRIGSPCEGVVDDSRLVTKLKSAAFVKPAQSNNIEAARKPISALLVAGFGCSPPEIRGVIHPYPARKFDQAILDQIEFCHSTIDFQTRTMTPLWTNPAITEKSMNSDFKCSATEDDTCPQTGG